MTELQEVEAMQYYAGRITKEKEFDRKNITVEKLELIVFDNRFFHIKGRLLNFSEHSSVRIVVETNCGERHSFECIVIKGEMESIIDEKIIGNINNTKWSIQIKGRNNNNECFLFTYKNKFAWDNLESIEKCKELYIYGAGGIGTKCAFKLRELGIDYEGFVVTSKKENQQNHLGKEVIDIGELKEKCSENTGVILAMNSQNKAEASEHLLDFSADKIYSF